MKGSGPGTGLIVVRSTKAVNFRELVQRSSEWDFPVALRRGFVLRDTDEHPPFCSHR